MLVPGSILDTKNPWLFQPHSWSYISVFMYPWIQPMPYPVVLKPFIEKNQCISGCTWFKHLVQRSTLICYSETLKIRCIPKCYRKLMFFEENVHKN